MKVQNRSHGDILTDFNGHRYTIPKGQIADIPPYVYDQIKSSGSVEAFDLVVVEETKIEDTVKQEESVTQTMPEIPAKILNKKFGKRGRPKKR